MSRLRILAGHRSRNALAVVVLLISAAGLVAGTDAAGQGALNTLAEVSRDSDGDRVPDRIGETVTVRAVAVCDAFAVQPAPLFRVYLDDGSAGVMVQSPNLELVENIRSGDTVVVEGIVGFYAGSPVMQPTAVDIVGQGTVPAPLPVSVDDVLAERYEGRLVSVQGKLVNAQNVEIVDSTGAVRVRARREILEDPEFRLRFRSESLAVVTGIASQFDPSSPHDGGYRIELLSADGVVLRTDYRPFLWAFGVFALIAAFWWRARTATRRATYTQQLLDKVSASESALKYSENRLRVVAEATSDVIWELDLVNRELLWGARASELLQAEPEVRVPDRTDHLEYVDEADQDRVQASFAKAIDGDAAFWEEEYRIVRRDGVVRYVRDSARILRDAEGAAQRVIGAIIDVTEQRVAEERERELQARIQHAQRLESLGILSSGIAHDFNNILAAIRGSADLLGESGDVSGGDHQLVEEIKKMSRRGVELTNRMLTYAGRAPTERKSVDLNQVVDDMIVVLGNIISKKVKLERELESGLPPVEGDEAQLQQVVMNFISNAVESLPEGEGRVTIRTSVRNADDASGSLIGTGVPSGDYVSLAVADNGAGIDTEDRDKIFEPFFTTKSTGRGLGLSAVLGIIKSHGGCLYLDSQPGRGTTFTTLFPIGQVDVDVPAVNEVAPKKNVSGGKVLIADDEDMVAQFVARALERLDLTADIVSDGKSAVDRVLNAQPGFDLVVLDVSMPGLNGDEAYEKIREAGVEVPVLFISGHGVYDLEQRLPAMANVAILPKPFTIEDLRSNVAILLNPHEHAIVNK